MKWEGLLTLLKGEVVFRSSMLFAIGESPAGIRRQLARWVRTGRLEHLRRGVYAIASPYRMYVPHHFVVAGFLRPGSYVSLQSALSHHGMIPEHVPSVTSVTMGRPETLETPLGMFLFRHISKKMLYGYESVDFGKEDSAFVACPEKALLDLVHLSRGGDREDFLREMRLQNLERLDPARLQALAERYGSPKLLRAAAVAGRLIAEDRA